MIGKSQLLKEMEELQNMENKELDNEALHRNEVTHEIEGQYAEEYEINEP